MTARICYSKTAMSFVWFRSMLSILLLCILVAGNLQAQDSLTIHSRPFMGTTFTLIIQTQDGDDADIVADKAFNEIERVEKIFSTYDPNSEVSRLNSTRRRLKVSNELVEVIQYAEALNRLSNGAFDVKIGSATKIWKNAYQSQTPLDHSKIDLEKKKKHEINIRKQRIKTSKFTSLDFGGIAKGYAVDKAFEKLKMLGFDTVLVDGGGDMRLGEAPKNVKGWKIGQFYEEGKILWLSNCAIATSGMDYQHIEHDNLSQSHILNPATLKGMTINRGVTVIANTCMEADALATTFSVTGKEAKLEPHYHFKVNIKENTEWIVKQF